MVVLLAGHIFHPLDYLIHLPAIELRHVVLNQLLVLHFGHLRQRELPAITLFVLVEISNQLHDVNLLEKADKVIIRNHLLDLARFVEAEHQLDEQPVE